VEEHLAENSSWQQRLSGIYYTPEVDLEVDVLLPMLIPAQAPPL
jgi:hypothetical protein